MSNARTTEQVPTVEVSVDGTVTTGQRARAIAQVTGVLETLDIEVTVVRLRLEQASDEPRRDAHARVAVHVPGRPVAVHADGATLDEAVTTLGSRLRQRLEHTVGRRRSRRRRFADSPDSHHHGDRLGGIAAR